MHFSSRLVFRAPGLLALLLVAACSGPSSVGLPPLRVVVASGDGQYGTPGEMLSLPLRVVVHTRQGQIPRAGITVGWDVESGDAAVTRAGTSVTDSTGSAEIEVLLGSTLGTVTVRATAIVDDMPSTTFTAYTVDRPQLDDVTPASGAAGTTITLTGSSFSPDPLQNVVLFSGVRGVVTAATSTSLTVEIPACLPAATVDVSVQLGSVASGTLSLVVEPGGVPLDVPLGRVFDVDDDAGFACLALPGDATYLLAVYSSSTVGAARHPYQLSVVGPGSGVAPAPVVAARAVGGEDETARASGFDLRGAWDYELRTLEGEALRARAGPVGTVPPPAPPAPPPAVGDRRSFQVYDGRGFTTVSATAEYVGTRAALYVDDERSAGTFSAGELSVLSDRFDGRTHPTVTGAFGEESDIDGNERVIILVTPVVNRLTPRGSGSFVGAFFFGIDLIPDRTGSNAGEVFYTLAPDPGGVHSDPRENSDLLGFLPAVLAHEFQHMVHFNQRILLRDALNVEATWLSEGLAQLAEELVADSYESGGDPGGAELFRSGNRTRARRYLADPTDVSLIISTGQGTLEERGGGFLALVYLEDVYGADLPGRLTRSIRTGVGNVEAETGVPWDELLADWASALYLDGPDPEEGPLAFPEFDVRGFAGAPYPLEPVGIGGGSFTASDELWSSSVAHYILVPEASAWSAVRLGGDNGAPSSPHVGLRLRVVRIS